MFTAPAVADRLVVLGFSKIRFHLKLILWCLFSVHRLATAFVPITVNAALNTASEFINHEGSFLMHFLHVWNNHS